MKNRYRSLFALNIALLLSGLVTNLSARNMIIDTIPPQITCPPDVSVIANWPGCKGLYGLQSPIYMDNSGMVKLEYSISGATVASGVSEVFDVTLNQGLSVVQYTVVDSSGNAASCSFGINVLCPVDGDMCLDRISQIAAQASFGTHYSSMNIDTFGNVISAGIFAGTVDFDPGPDDYILTSSLLYGDIYVSKTDPDGKLLWCKQFGEAGGNLDGVPVATLDPAGNVYVSSLFHGAIDFDPGPEVFTLVSDDADVFILKLSKDGDFRWAGQIGGNENDVPNDIAVDATGNVYSAGNFTSAADFDPGDNTYILGDQTTFQYHYYISKWDSSGAFVWAKLIEFALSGIDVESSGNIFMNGNLNYETDLDPGPDTFLLTPPGPAHYISKLNTDSDFQWARQLNGRIEPYSKIIADAGDVYLTGAFDGTVDFDPGLDSFALSTSQAGDFDAFIAKFDGAGNLNWARQLGGFGEESGIDLKVDKAGAVYSNGIFRTIIDLDPDPVITYNLGDLSGISNYVSKLDAAGHFIWAKKIGKNAGLLSLGIDPAGCVYLGGTFYADGDIDPSIDTVILKVENGALVTHKMCPCQALNTSENPGLSDADLPLHAFPNPFTQFTTIEYENPDLALVHLSVFDLNGREVALLVNGLQTPGTHHIVFGAQNLSPGPYYVVLTAGKYRTLQKLILNR